MLAVALGYTVQSRLVDHANFMSSGFDHTAQLAFSLNAAAGRLLGLSEQQIATPLRWLQSAMRLSPSFAQSRCRNGRASLRRSRPSVP
jgi:2-methylcitrate dehydratase PrpD